LIKKHKNKTARMVGCHSTHHLHLHRVQVNSKSMQALLNLHITITEGIFRSWCWYGLL